MQSHRIAGLAFALALLASPAVQAQTYGPEDEGRRFDDGTRVVCRDVAQTYNSKDPNRISGTVAGAVVGGLIGNQIGDGSGRKLATVGGGAIGRHVQGERQENRGQRVVERRCERVR